MSQMYQVLGEKSFGGASHKQLSVWALCLAAKKMGKWGKSHRLLHYIAQALVFDGSRSQIRYANTAALGLSLLSSLLLLDEGASASQQLTSALKLMSALWIGELT